MALFEKQWVFETYIDIIREMYKDGTTGIVKSVGENEIKSGSPSSFSTEPNIVCNCYVCL